MNGSTTSVQDDCQSPETSGIFGSSSSSTTNISNNTHNIISNGVNNLPQRASTCASCQKQITDPFILRVNPNLEFHAGCLKCCSCDCELDEKCTAFVRDGQTFCRGDYLRLFGQQKCSRCSNTFDRTDMVMRARNLVYHVSCFTCVACGATLMPGERFLIKDEELYCRTECFNQCQQNSSRKQIQPDFSSHNSVVFDECKMSPQSVKSEDGDGLSTSTTPSSLCALIPPHYTPSLNMGNGGNSMNTRSSISSSSNNSSSSKKSKKDKPSTRVRTVLTDQQLRVLKQMYGNNSRPDAVTKENLVEMTGLSARVIRVWFQNKRCKDKKRQTAMKEAQRTAEKEQALHGVRLNGIGPLVAESASTDPSLAMAPISIHQYPQNPSLWSHNDNSPDVVPPPPYMMMNPGNGYNDLPARADYGGYAGPNGYMGADYSSLSSPSCSD